MNTLLPLLFFVMMLWFAFVTCRHNYYLKQSKKYDDITFPINQIQREWLLALLTRAYRGGEKRRYRVSQYVNHQAEIVRNDARRYGLIGGAAV